ncbi:MAG: molybdate ABC transporter substrate-binding protein [Proteobacteria bacterium]|nr:MAG: molybdate ABC transporter substrate-binding protein [Pseudomonadota bacterium]
MKTKRKTLWTRRPGFRWAFFLALCLFADLPARGALAQDGPLIAAASDLQFALEEIAAAFTAGSGQKVRLSFGSSGNFARQIRQGAPIEVFLSADENYVLALARDGFAKDQGALYAMGRIVLIVPHGSPLKADGTLVDLKAALNDGRLIKFAIANPEHAPYGKRAEEALRHQGLWDAIAPNLVYGENVSQAAQFATSANAQGGLIAYSLALSPRVSALGSYALIPEDWHSPLRQRMVLLKNAGPAAERFYAFVQQPAARAIFQKYGFVLPGEPERR